MNFDKLNQYPAAIAQAATRVNELEAKIANLRQRQDEIEGWVDAQVALSDHKNDSRRKAARFEILQSKGNYQVIVAELEEARNAKANALTELEMLRNQFTVEKLAVKAAIANQLAGLDGAIELVGV